MAGHRKEFEADFNPSCYALKYCFYATFRFDTLALSYFNFKISFQKKLARKPQKYILLL